MTIFVLKIIAYISMVLDHVKYVVPITNCFITQYFGRITYPLFAFFLTEGYVHTHDLKKYYIRLIKFALISEVPFIIFRFYFVSPDVYCSIIITLLIGLIAITVIDKCKYKIISAIVCLALITLADYVRTDYGAYGILVIIVMYLFRNSKLKLTFFFTLLVAVYLNSRSMLSLDMDKLLYFIFYVSPIIFIDLYNGKEGRKMSYSMYWFYPIHLIIFSAIGFYVYL